MLHTSDIQRFVERGQAHQKKAKRDWIKRFVLLLGGVILFVLPTYTIDAPARLYNFVPDDAPNPWDSELELINQFALRENHTIWGTGEAGFIYRLDSDGLEDFAPSDYQPEGDYDHTLRDITYVSAYTPVIATNDYYVMYQGRGNWHTEEYPVPPHGNVLDIITNGYTYLLLDDTGYLTDRDDRHPVHKVIGIEAPAPPYSMTQARTTVWLATSDTLWAKRLSDEWQIVQEFAVDNVRLLNATDDYLWLASEANQQIVAVSMDEDNPSAHYYDFREIGLPDDAQIGRVRAIKNTFYLMSDSGMFEANRTDDTDDMERITWSPSTLAAMPDGNMAFYDISSIAGNVHAVAHPVNDYGNLHSSNTPLDALLLALSPVLAVIWAFGWMLRMLVVSIGSNDRKKALNERMNALFPGDTSKEADADTPRQDGNKRKGTSNKPFQLSPLQLIGSFFGIVIVLSVIGVPWYFHVIVFLLWMFLMMVNPLTIFRQYRSGDKAGAIQQFSRGSKQTLIIIASSITGLMIPFLVITVWTVPAWGLALFFIGYAVLTTYLLRIANYVFFIRPAMKGDVERIPNDFAKLLEKGQFEEAEDKLRETLNTQSQYDIQTAAVLLHALGRSLEAQGQLESALRYYTIALDIYPEDANRYLALAEYHLMYGDPQMALALTDAMLVMLQPPRFYQPERAIKQQEIYQAQAIHAAALAANGRHDEANTLIKQTLRDTDSSFVRLYVTILHMTAYVLYQQGQSQKARKYIKRALTTYPHSKHWPELKMLWQQTAPAT